MMRHLSLRPDSTSTSTAAPRSRPQLSKAREESVRAVPAECGSSSREYAILADTLDPDELKLALHAMAYNADEIGDEIVRRFGGKRLIDA